MAKVKGSVKSNKKPFAKGASVRKGYTSDQKDFNAFSIGTSSRATKRKRPSKKATK